MCPPQYQVISFYLIGQAVPVKSEASAVRRNDPKRVFGASDVCESWSTGIEATCTSFHGLQGIVQELARWVTSRPSIHLFVHLCLQLCEFDSYQYQWRQLQVRLMSSMTRGVYIQNLRSREGVSHVGPDYQAPAPLDPATLPATLLLSREVAVRYFCELSKTKVEEDLQT